MDHIRPGHGFTVPDFTIIDMQGIRTIFCLVSEE